MKVVKIDEIKNLKKLDIGSSQNTEGSIYILNNNTLLKILYNKDGEDFASKLQAVSLMKDKEKELQADEFVIPTGLAIYKNEVIGYTVPYIKNAHTLNEMLNSKLVSRKDKIRLLKKVGQILKKIEYINKRGILDLTINDLHEDNILVTKDKKIKLIDLDSVYLGNNYPVGAKYLIENDNLYDIKKYKCNEEGIFYPDRNTDIYCYNLIILNAISKSRMDYTSLPDFFSYIDYLESIGYGDKLLNSFKKIYLEGNNINPYNYLTDIPANTKDKENYMVYAKKMGYIK